MLSTPPLAMSTRSSTIAGKKRTLASPIKCNEQKEDNNNTAPKTPRKEQARTPPMKQIAISTTREQARTFAKWYQDMMDDDRHNFGLYLADEVILEWFGRTIKTRKKVAGFLEYDMQCSRHDFTTVEGSAAFTARAEKNTRLVCDTYPDQELATPLVIAETPTAKIKSSLTLLSVRGSSLKKRPGLRSNSTSPEKGITSPEWEKNALKHNLDDTPPSDKKRVKVCHADTMDIDSDSGNGKSETRKPRCSKFRRNLRFDDDARPGDEINNSGDSNVEKRKIVSTPYKMELGQGDCLPSTSGTGSVCNARTSLISRLPRKYVECNGFIQFTRTRTVRGADVMKWERKCKVQVAFTEDPVNVGEYIIWTIIYSDDIKCRRNLLAAFEEVAKEEGKRKKLF